jgi:steroid delta-isomerase-like uncharacterized protein
LRPIGQAQKAGALLPLPRALHLQRKEGVMAMADRDIDGFVRKVIDIYNSRDVTRFDELLADDCVLVRNGIEARGKDAVKRVLGKLYSAIPDIEYRIDDVVAAGDKVALRWSGRGTHSGEYMGVPPTGKQLRYDGITFYELNGDRLQRIWVSVNLLGLLRVLSARVPAEPQPHA